MKKMILLLLFNGLLTCISAQSSYAEAIQQGDEAFDEGAYRTAFSKYFAAEAFDPSKKEAVKAKINRVFDKIEALRAEVEKQRVRAERARAGFVLDKMRILYIGVENPVTLYTNGILPSEVEVEAEGVQIRSRGAGRYIVTATAPGWSTIRAYWEGRLLSEETFQVRRIPDPVALLGGLRESRTMSTGEFKSHHELTASLKNFIFHAQCTITYFEVVHLAPREDPVVMPNTTGNRFSESIQRIVNRAQPDDQYIFDQIKCLCPGDASERDLGSLYFKMK